jgi:hypothetical protein
MRRLRQGCQTSRERRCRRDRSGAGGHRLNEIRNCSPATTGRSTSDSAISPNAKLPDIDELTGRANAVRRWLEMTSACECESLDFCSLFDDRVLGLNEQTAPTQSPSVLVIAPTG